MIVSHERQFILFPDPLGAAAPIVDVMRPWGDMEIARYKSDDPANPYFEGMTPVEAEWAFDADEFAFRNYLRISVTENPFARLARLYDRIAQTDPIWHFRHLTSIGIPSFNQWLAGTCPDGLGAGSRNSPRWRQHGAWSSKYWEAGRITHTIRLEAAEEDLAIVFGQLGIAPSVDLNVRSSSQQAAWLSRYTTESTKLMRQRYGWDLAQYGYSAPRAEKAA